LIGTFEAELKSAEIPDESAMLEFSVDNLEVGSGSVFNLPVYVNDASDLRSLGAVLSFDPDVIEVLDVSLSMGSSAMLASNIDNATGKVKVAMAAAHSVTNDGILLMLNVKARGDVGAYSDVTLTEIYTNFKDISIYIVNGSVEVQITTDLLDNEVKEVTIYPVYPNPADDQFRLSYSVKDENTLVNIGIYQINGALIKQVVNDYQSQGNYHLNVTDIDGLSGTYILRVVVGDKVKNQKLIIK
jgi:hypothetical protein